jgi:hypothetical protein
MYRFDHLYLCCIVPGLYNETISACTSTVIVKRGKHLVTTDARRDMDSVHIDKKRHHNAKNRIIRYHELLLTAQCNPSIRLAIGYPVVWSARFLYDTQGRFEISL